MAFLQEKIHLEKILGGLGAKVQHIGSTAVEGLGAKPIIDILVGLPSSGLLDEVAPKMVAAGYAYYPKHEETMPRRRFFKKELPANLQCHIHMVKIGGEFWTKHLRFRDHLRSHKADRLAYHALKLDLADREWGSGSDYADAKTEFIRGIEAKAAEAAYPIREAMPGDIAQIQAVRHSVKENVLSAPEKVTDQHVHDYITRRGKGWVCLAEGQIIGFAIADLQDHNVWALFIDPRYEGRGIGGRLHRAMLDWYFSQTTETLWLTTDPDTRAEQFYRDRGWEDKGLDGHGERRFEVKAADWKG